MVMTIEKSISWIKKSILDMRSAQICISDKLALKTAIETMQKYQKIKQIVEHWACCGNVTDSMMEISEVVENENVD